MAASKKPRILFVAKILLENTDAETGLTLPELQSKLSDYDIEVERKALYRDFIALEEAGLQIERLKTRPVSYAIAKRLFTPAQQMLLADAVQTSKSITQGNSTELIERIKHLGSKRQAEQLSPRIHFGTRVQIQNESVFNTVDLIQQAIAEKRDISFSYMRYDVKKRLQEVPPRDGGERIRTPLFLIYDNEHYYLLAYDEEARDHIRVYRVDRMNSVMLLGDSPATHKVSPEFDLERFEQETLGMFNAKPTKIVLEVTEEAMSGVMDIFGDDGSNAIEVRQPKELETYEGDSRRWAHITVRTAVNPVLFGKLAQFGGDVRIVKPSRVAQQYKDHLIEILESHRLLEG